MNKLDLQRHSQNGTRSHARDLLYLMPLDCPLKSGYDGKVYVMCILPQSKEFFKHQTMCQRAGWGWKGLGGWLWRLSLCSQEMMQSTVEEQSDGDITWLKLSCFSSFGGEQHSLSSFLEFYEIWPLPCSRSLHFLIRMIVIDLYIFFLLLFLCCL